VAKINGTVEGDIHASKELVLGRTANVKQSCSTCAIVEEGARFNGSCRAGDLPSQAINVPANS
jgi:cytoskeletal protein CcmA (bactofilin family)